MSKWYEAIPASWGRDVQPADLNAWLAELPIGDAVLMPCSDEWVSAVARLPLSTMPRFRSWVPGTQAIDSLVNKDRFRERLESLDLPHPRTFALDRPDQLTSIPDHYFEHAFLKPHESQGFFSEFGVKALFVDNRDDA
ncbi:MAG: hypothetical protein QNJ07_17295, partial [Woeseiaceae bacterium]|nr:hypothetical protein [Woeseiaceae bacterium]